MLRFRYIFLIALLYSAALPILSKSTHAIPSYTERESHSSITLNFHSPQTVSTSLEIANKQLLFTIMVSALLFLLMLAISFQLIRKYKAKSKALFDANKKLNHINTHLESIVQNRTRDLVAMLKKAKESDKLKSTFLANMSHEIRTPLNGILGFARFLSDETLSPSTRKQYLEVINRRGKALLQIVNDLINISLIDAGQVEIKAEPFNLNQLLFDLYTIFNSESNEKKKPNVVLKLNLSVNDSRSNIISDASRIEQILTNLIDNSLKFTHSGSVEFGYTIEKNDTIKFFVKDTGIGIPPNMREKVFCRFNRDENSTPYHTSGTGLGLPITKGLVSLLDGEIWFDSQIDLGTNFYFTIPYQKSESIDDPYTSKSSISTQNLNFEYKKILVVEDDLISYQFVEALLKGTNAKIIHAKNGEDAIEICHLVPDIDLVIMDMRLPFIDGYEATTQIKKQNPKLRVIAQTANVLSDDRSKCLEAGCDDYIPKPLDPDEFLRLIAHYIKKTEISRIH